jgi:aryl sulfotransferase
MLVRAPIREYRTWVVDSRYWAGYIPRDDDIIIASAPKCGTTWMQQGATAYLTHGLLVDF